MNKHRSFKERFTHFSSPHCYKRIMHPVVREFLAHRFGSPLRISFSVVRETLSLVHHREYRWYRLSVFVAITEHSICHPNDPCSMEFQLISFGFALFHKQSRSLAGCVSSHHLLRGCTITSCPDFVVLRCVGRWVPHSLWIFSDEIHISSLLIHRPLPYDISPPQRQYNVFHLCS